MMTPQISDIKTPALLFDLDGTLVDSVPDLLTAVNTVLAEDGRPALDRPAITAMIGNGARKLMERAYRHTGGLPAPRHDGEAVIETLYDRFMAVYGDHPSTETTLYPGVVETLTALRDAGHPMAVVTNKPEQPAVALLKKLDLLKFFTVVIGGGSTPALKPDPLPLTTALDRLNATGRPAVMIGDSLNDSAAARAAGLPSVCVTFGYCHGPLESLGADALIDHFTQVPQAVAQVLTAPAMA
ncbi:phosphoglycolate phosphatase [Novispirillum itersonii]|uniref:phosphoglycolate phosphatase n=1 Tax=Novispirillum itersonii TaxID=189 RepID=UPI0003A7847B|nr:phosphoglycolate phosphatase [Novispirillum itersonii]